MVEAVDGRRPRRRRWWSRPCCSASDRAKTGAPLPAASAASASPSCGQSDWEYRPSSNASYSWPAPATLPPPAGTGDDAAAPSRASSAVVGSPAGRQGQAALPAHQVKNALSTFSKPTACPCGHLVEGERGIDHAVEHHGPDVRGEERGVGEPEQRAVGLPHVGQPAVPERLAQPVHVAGDVDRPDVGKHGGARLLARRRELLEPRDGRRLLARRGRRRGRTARTARVRAAGDRVAALDAAGVEQHDVEVVEQLRRQRVELVGHVVDARHARPAGVDDERPDAGGGLLRRMTGHGDGDGGAVGMRVVQGDDERAALQIAVAGGPGHRGHRRLGGRRRGGRVVLVEVGARDVAVVAGGGRRCDARAWVAGGPGSAQPAASRAARAAARAARSSGTASSSPRPALHVLFRRRGHRSPGTGTPWPGDRGAERLARASRRSMRASPPRAGGRLPRGRSSPAEAVTEAAGRVETTAWLDAGGRRSPPVPGAAQVAVVLGAGSDTGTPGHLSAGSRGWFVAHAS